METHENKSMVKEALAALSARAWKTPSRRSSIQAKNGTINPARRASRSLHPHAGDLSGCRISGLHGRPSFNLYLGAGRIYPLPAPAARRISRCHLVAGLMSQVSDRSVRLWRAKLSFSASMPKVAVGSSRDIRPCTLNVRYRFSDAESGPTSFGPKLPVSDAPHGCHSAARSIHQKRTSLFHKVKGSLSPVPDLSPRSDGALTDTVIEIQVAPSRYRSLAAIASSRLAKSRGPPTNSNLPDGSGPRIPSRPWR
jgi:hypothetical protein